MFKSLQGYNALKDIVKEQLGPAAIFDVSEKGEGDIEEARITVESRGPHVLGITGRLFDIDDWLEGPDVNTVKDEDGSMVVTVADAEDRDVVLANIRTICQSLGYVVTSNIAADWCSPRVPASLATLANTPATSLRARCRSRYFAARDTSSESEQSESVTEQHGILCMGLAAGPARLRDDELGGGWRASSTRDVTPVSRRRKRSEMQR